MVSLSNVSAAFVTVGELGIDISFVQSARFLFGALIRSVRCHQYGQNGPLYQILELPVSKTENGPTYFVGRSRLTTTSFIDDEETSATPGPHLMLFLGLGKIRIT